MSKKEIGSISDTTPLVTVEDLINRALGPDNTNQVDFKLLQAILQIFARQQRLLQQRVQLRLSDRTKSKKKKPKKSLARGVASLELDDDIDDDTERSLDLERTPDQDDTPEKDGEKSRGKKKAKKTKGSKKSEKERESGKGSKVSSGLEISETVRDKEKVLVVERGPPTPSTPRTPRDDGGTGRGPIDVVTRRQFATVEASLEQLRAAASAHRLADRGDVAEEVKRLAARVQAAERAAGQLAATVCELADCGVLPRELRVAVQSLGYPPEYRRSRRSSIVSAPPYVARYDLDAIMSDATAELTGAVVAATARAAESAEWALRKAQAVGEKMERASSLSVRLSTLQALVEDYFQQTAGFETGLTTQIRQFQEQIEQIEADLGAGLDQLKHVNTNTETAAVIALRERYEELVAQVEATAADGQAAAADQAKLAREIHNLAQALENLKEQKCDRAEVVDGLRDKATSSQLQGLLRVERFERTRDELDDRLDAFHDLFHEQETRWMEALKELSDRSELKAQYSELVHARDEAQAQLRAIDDRLRTLAHAIGEPQVAFLTRSLLADMLCASCRDPALPAARDPALPAARDPALPDARDPAHRHTHSDGESVSPRVERHACRRWCGGSHTLVAGTRAPPPAPPAPRPHRPHRPARTYTGYGDDGRLYQMQEECQPCLQCNKVEHTTSQHGRGDGDQK